MADSMISGQWREKGMEWSERGLIWELFSHIPGVIEENGETFYRITSLRIKKYKPGCPKYEARV